MNVKKLLTIVMLLSIVFVVAACTTTEEVTEVPAPTEAPAEAPTEAPMEEPTVAPTEEPMEEPAPTEEAMAEEPTGEGTFLERAMAGEFAGSVVTLMGVMVEEEEVLMNNALVPFEEATGIDVQYQGTKEFETQMVVRVDAGDPPDVADIPQPGLLKTFVDRGEVVDVSEFLSPEWLQSQYNQGWLDLATYEGPDGTIMAGVWNRAANKSLVWYPKAVFDAAGYEVPTTWDELLALTQTIADDGDTAWCIGIESGNATGWVATDWVEDLMLRTTSPENYDAWVAGELPFNSPEVKRAAELMGEIWLNSDYVLGGTDAIVTTFIGDSPVPMFTDPPQCWLHKQAAWIQSFFGEGLTAGVDYDFFYFPPVDPEYDSPVLGAADIMVAFTDRPETKALMEYFATGESAEAWVRAGAALSPHQDSSLEWYTTDIDRRIAEILLNTQTFRFDASDLMPAEVGAGTFWTGMVDYISGSVDLETALQEIDDSWPQD